MENAQVVLLFMILALIVVLWMVIHYWTKGAKGDFEVVSREEVSRNHYSDMFIDLHGNPRKRGESVVIVTKITYRSGRVEYKTTEYKC